MLLLLLLQLQALVETARAGVPIEEGVVPQASLLLILLPAACGVEHPRGCKKMVNLEQFFGIEWHIKWSTPFTLLPHLNTLVKSNQLVLY